MNKRTLKRMEREAEKELEAAGLMTRGKLVKLMAVNPELRQAILGNGQPQKKKEGGRTD